MPAGCVCQEHENPPDAFLDFIQERTKISADVPQPEGSAACVFFTLSYLCPAPHTFTELSLGKKFKHSKHGAVSQSELEKSGIYAVKIKSAHDFSSSAYASTFARQALYINIYIYIVYVSLQTCVNSCILYDSYSRLL